MEDTAIEAQTGEEEEPQCSLNKEIQLTDKCILEITANSFKRLPGVQEEKELSSDSKQQLIGKRGTQDSRLRGIQAIELGFTKYIRFASLGENYLQYCLDLLELRGANSPTISCRPSVPCGISLNLIPLNKGVLFGSELGQCRHIRRNTSDLGAFVIQCNSSTRSQQWIVSTIDRIKSARNSLSAPVLHNLGALVSNMNTGRVRFTDIEGKKETDSLSFSSTLCITPKKSGVDISRRGNLKYGSKSFNKLLFSLSNAKSSGSDQSSALSSTTFCQGMLHCKWDDGIPHFTYFVDDQRELYVAKVLKVQTSDFKGLDYVYSFYTNKGGRKAHGTCDYSLEDLVGKMTVSSCVTLSSNSENSELIETEFILFATDGIQIGNTDNSDSLLGKAKVYPNKVTDIFRPKHMVKQRSALKFTAQSSIPKNHSLDLYEHEELNQARSGNLLGSPPNHELAAIVVKGRVPDKHKEAVVGGWGLKFLEKVRVERVTTSQETSVSSEDLQESHSIHKSNCSTNINVILPAGIHAGSRTGNAGPSSLIERWRSGGNCDCGGWDIGCPLTVLNNQSSSPEGESNLLNLVKAGAKQAVPSLKMLNIEDDKYQIRFQSSLTVLQSFSIGVAMIHSQSHSLISETVKKLRQ